MAIFVQCPAPHCGRKQALDNDLCRKCGFDIKAARKRNAAVYFVYVHHRVEGQKWRKVGRSLTVAREQEKILQVDLLKGEYAPPDRSARLKAFFEKDYMPYAKRTKRSWDKDESRFKNYLLPFFGDCRLTDIKPGTVEKFKEKRLADQTRRKENTRPATLNRDLALLRRIFNLAKRWGVYRGDNPVSTAGLLPENNSGIAKFLCHEEAGRLFEQLPTETRPIFEFAAASGFRISNVLNLRWDQIDKASRIINLPKTKSGRALRMPLNDWMIEIMGRVPRRIGSPYVFCRLDTGEPYKHIHVGFKSALVKAGLDPKIRIHDLRHSYCSWAVAQGVPLSVLRDLMGHSTLAMLSRYSHSGTEILVEMANRVTSPFGKDANHRANTAP